ncbi:MAG: hypothetical protein J6R86_08230 [Lentisphaeria bacterium]|nr:hypothetical protein [Lentisphaeria bacterium]
MRNFYPWQIKVFKLIVLIISFLPTVWICTWIFQSKSVLSVLSYAPVLVVSLYFYGIVASLLYSGTFAGNFTDFLFYPRYYLKTPPVITTRQHGLITAGKYELAEKELFELREKNPASPEVAMMLADLHAEIFNDPQQGIADIMFFRRKRHLRHHELNLQIMMRCTDFLLAANQPAQAVELLESEIKIPFVYTKRERNVLRQRIEILKTQLT